MNVSVEKEKKFVFGEFNPLFKEKSDLKVESPGPSWS
jgi:hypothetical protein